VYGGVPPVAVIVALPSGLLQNEVVSAFVNAIAVGWVIVALAVALHPSASVIVTVYDPTVNPVALEFVCPLVHE
jgi:hypothetical protein